MQTALQLGQRQLLLPQILKYLTTSAHLPQYLSTAIVEETLAIWQQSPEYNLAAAKSPDLLEQITKNGDRLLAESQQTAISPQQKALILHNYKQAQWGHQISSYFLVRKAQLDRVIFSAIEIENLGMAQEIYLRVKEYNQSFAKLARLYSQGAEAKLGGIVGPISIEQLHPTISHQLNQLKPGELSPLFQINNLHIFIRLEQYLPARFNDEMKQYLLDELFENWLQQAIANRIARLSLTDLC